MSASNGWLLDTNILSELRRSQPERSVVRFVASCPPGTLFISTVTLAEIRFGISLVTAPDYRQSLTQWFERSVRESFARGVLPISEDILYRWRVLVEEGRRVGHTFSQPDLFLAATAIEHGLVLVTRNIKDFTQLDLEMLNPWRS